jgi:hypothetical protein
MEWNYIAINGVTSATEIVLKNTVEMSLPWNQYKAVRQQRARADEEDEAESDESEE